MKKEYIEPLIQLVYVDSNDMICTSGGPDYAGNEEGGESEAFAHVRRNAIWDDYE